MQPHRTSSPSYRPSRAGDLIGHNRRGQALYLPGGGAPDADPTGTDDTDDTAYAFPFAVPGDLAAETVTDEDLVALLGQVREHAGTFAPADGASHTDDTLAALRACRDLAVNVRAEQTRRADAATAAASRGEQAATLAAELDDVLAQPDPTPAPTPAPNPTPTPTPDGGGSTAVTAAGRPPARPPSVRQVAANRPAGAQVVPAPGPDEDRSGYAVMAAAADVPGFASGQRLERFADAGRALAARLDQYPVGSAAPIASRKLRPVTVYDPDQPGRVLTMTRWTRHNAVQFRREFPDELRVRDEARGYAVAEHAANERRLPGGNLRESAKLALKRGGSLTAAQGWCAPSEVIYELCELETRDGVLDLPEMQSARGGFQVPSGGGPNFATIWSGIGNAGDTHLTEAEVIADTAKVCYEIPCPDFTDVRLGVDYVCLTGGLLQRRGYPEVVARFGRGAMIAMDHKVNAGVITAIVTAAGAANAIPADLSGDDAISSLLAGVELAIVDMKYRNRMGFNATLEVVLPYWVLAPMRAAASRRSGVALISVSDAMIMDWFSERGAVPRFVYDWQDSFAGLVGGPGAATPLTALPTSVEFLVYPAGTFVKAVQDVVNLDTVYDSTNLQANQYTAVFVEDGWAVLQMCPAVERYSVPVDPSGVVGCCPANLTS